MRIQICAYLVWENNKKMRKIPTNLTLPHEIINACKNLKINMSKECSDFLQTRIEQELGDNIDIIKIDRRIEEIKEQQQQLQVEQNHLLSQRVAYQERLKKEEEEQLQVGEKEAKAVVASGMVGELGR